MISINSIFENSINKQSKNRFLTITDLKNEITTMKDMVHKITKNIDYRYYEEVTKLLEIESKYHNVSFFKEFFVVYMEMLNQKIKNFETLYLKFLNNKKYRIVSTSLNKINDEIRSSELNHVKDLITIYEIKFYIDDYMLYKNKITKVYCYGNNEIELIELTEGDYNVE